MTIDVQTKALLAAMAEAGGGLNTLGVDEAREALRQLSFDGTGPEIAVGRLETRKIDGPGGAIPIRIYWPETTPASQLPVIVFFHGGGFALGDLDTHDNMCRYFCMHVGAIVINVDYRRSPENKYPAAHDDCFAALSWTSEHAEELGGDAARIAVAGDSAGGNLAAATTLMARDRGGPPIAFQVLLYPGLESDPTFSTPSRKAFGGGDYFLSQADVDWITDMYFTDASQMTDIYASPLRAGDLAGLPSALILSAGYDMLRDENKEYADRLESAGVDVEYKCFDSTIHGFVTLSAIIDAGKGGLKLITDRMKKRLTQ